MKILYLDTTSEYLYTGIVSDDKLIIEKKDKLEKDLSVFTLSIIDEMFKLSNLHPQDIDKIIVVNGPGSFTGIRIGVTLAKVYAWSLNKQITTITSLEAMSISSDSEKMYKVPVIDARRSAVFAGIYDRMENKVLNNQYIRIESLKDMLNDLPNEYVIISNKQVESIGQVEQYSPNILKIVKHYQNKENINPHNINPEYLKLTEAEESKNVEFL